MLVSASSSNKSKSSKMLFVDVGVVVVWLVVDVTSVLDVFDFFVGGNVVNLMASLIRKFGLRFVDGDDGVDGDGGDGRRSGGGGDDGGNGDDDSTSGL